MSGPKAFTLIGSTASAGNLLFNVSVGTILISLTLRILGVPSATWLKKPALCVLVWTFFAGISVAEFVPLEEAKEIIDGRTLLTDPRLPVNTYKSSEDPANPGHEISDADWAGYTPPLPYVKNTSRNLQFNESDFIASPGAPDGVTTYIQTSDGYTWGSITWKKITDDFFHGQREERFQGRSEATRKTRP